MQKIQIPSEVVGQLSNILKSAPVDSPIKRIIEAKGDVLRNYQHVFHKEALPDLTAETFQEFLNFRNNKHWSAIHRSKQEICADMPRLRHALSILIDESQPISKRLDLLMKESNFAVSGLGCAILTAILQVSFPEKYGVWNRISEAALRVLGMLPSLKTASKGQRYEAINEVFKSLAASLEIDLWSLDALFCRVESPLELEEEMKKKEFFFDFEDQLHAFLRSHWEKTELGQEWKLYEEDGELLGYKYKCPVGEIDLLARSPDLSRWLVVELKRDRAGDRTVGQVLRYKGWVAENLACGSEVTGLIIGHKADQKLQYALSQVKGVDFMLYEIDFRLNQCKDMARKSE